MELLIPIVATAGLTYMNTNSENKKEAYNNLDNKKNKKLIQNVVPPKNYPIISNNELRDSTVQGYKSEQPRDRYYNKNVLNDKKVNEQKREGFTSLTGENMKYEDLKHNNMQPYFGAKIRGKTLDFNSSETILDNQVGAGSQRFSKTEVAPLFKPQQNYNHISGAPNQSEFYRSRVNPSMKMSNVKPWEEVRVAPGLNQGFTASGSSQGYNSSLEARDSYKPKTVDQLRADNNPKMSFSLDGHAGPANSYIKEYANQKNIGKVEKNRPDRFYDGFESMKTDQHALGWGFTTTGLEKGQTARSNPILKHENRTTAVSSYEGIASSEQKASYIPGQYSESHREPSKATPITSLNAIGKSVASENDYGKNSFSLQTNNRTDCDNEGVFGAIKGAMGAAVAPFVDILKPSRKENYIGNIRQYGNLSIPVSGSGYTNNPNDQLKVTNREMDVCAENHLNVDGPRSGAYYLQKHNASHNKQNLHQEYLGASGGSGISKGLTSYESAYHANVNENRENLMASRTNHGNANHYNHDVNYQTGKLECDRVNTYIAPAGSSLTSISSSASHMGIMDKPHKQGVDIGVQRIEPNMLDAFKQNPYTHSLSSIY